MVKFPACLMFASRAMSVLLKLVIVRCSTPSLLETSCHYEKHAIDKHSGLFTTSSAMDEESFTALTQVVNFFSANLIFASKTKSLTLKLVIVMLSTRIGFT